ncbi:MAG: phosphoribosyltransferase [Bacteroidota bacterium]|nr:phosphoribosyltransferase [Bacteroidota bacterium]
MPHEKLILTAETAEKKMQRMAYEIVEHNIGERQLILAGIKENGLIIAYKIKAFLQKVYDGEIMVIEINLDKKDPKKIAIPGTINFDDKVIIMVDDVANTGKTLLYAVKPFLQFYPKKIQTLVLVERSHKEFPVSPDYVGLSVSTGLNEKIIVETEKGEVAGARLEG